MLSWPKTLHLALGLAALHGAAPALADPAARASVSVVSDRAEAPEDSEPAEDSQQPGGQVALFQDVRIPRGEVRRGDIVCIFGDVDVEGEITGDLVVIGGTLRLAGKADQDVVAVLSTITIEEGASIEHDLVNAMGTLENHGRVGHQTMNIPMFFRPIRLHTAFGTIGSILAWLALLLSILMFFVLLLLAALAPDAVRVLSQEVPLSYPLAFFVGIAGYIALLVTHALLWITVLGIPLSGMLYLAFLVCKWLGVAGICRYIGRGVGRLFGRELATLPAVLVGILPLWALLLVPMFLGGIGFFFAFGFRLLYWALVEIPAVGLVILTRAGTRPRSAGWTTSAPVVVPPPAPPAPPPPPSYPPPLQPS